MGRRGIVRKRNALIGRFKTLTERNDPDVREINQIIKELSQMGCTQTKIETLLRYGN